MKRLTILFAYLLFSLPYIVMAQDPKVNVKVDTPAGSVEVNRPPPQPIVVQTPPQRTVVVEKQAAPAAAPAPSAGCNCNMTPSYASAFGFLTLMPGFSLPFILRKKAKKES